MIIRLYSLKIYKMNKVNCYFSAPEGSELDYDYGGGFGGAGTNMYPAGMSLKYFLLYIYYV